MTPLSLSRNLFAWNAMISGRVKENQGLGALKLYNQMQTEGVKPDAFTFARVLKACASLLALEEGRLVHAQVIQSECEADVYVGSTLVDMYAKCGSVKDAQRVFQKMPTRNLVSWTTMLNGYVKNGQVQQALKLFAKMQDEGLKPNAVTFTVVLNACASMMALEEGRRVHAQVIQSGCESDIFVGGTLVDMYAKCGCIEDARTVFDAMPARNMVSWTAMLAGYVRCEQGEKALELFAQMQEKGVKPNTATFVVALNACATAMALEEGKRVHTQLIESGCESDMVVGSSLLGMYAKCGSIEDSQRVFQKMHTRDVVSWTAMLAGHLQCGQAMQALELFAQMQAEHVIPNGVTYVVVLNACASIRALEEGRHIHKQIMHSICKSDVFVGNALVDMYAKCGSIEDAQKVFLNMSTRDVVTWGTMLGGYLKYEQGQKALELFAQMQEEGMKPNSVIFVLALNACARTMALEEVSWNAMLSGYERGEQGQKAVKLFAKMQEEGVQPNPVTFVVVLKACASIPDLEEGRHAHSLLIQRDFCSDVFVGSALVDMYAKCGSIEDAERVFHKMPTQNVVSWNALISGYEKCNQGQKALKLFACMQEKGLEPDSATFVVVLNACASVMALDEGRRVHALLIQSDFESHLVVSSALVDMYAKCGSIEEAQRVFHKTLTKDVVAWNGMLGSFAMHGKGLDALQLFQEMHQAGVNINTVTFTCLLSACSHGGLVEEGIQLFETMDSVYGVSPTVEHHICMVDLLGRAGCLDDAENFLRSEPKISKDVVALQALLGACRNHGKVEMGKHIAKTTF